MNRKSVISGTFSDYRLVKSRGVLQLVVEIPVERQAEAFGALGYPMPGEEIHVALARLLPGAGAEPERIISESATLSASGLRSRSDAEAAAASSGASVDAGGRTGGSIPPTGADTERQRRAWHTLPPQQRAGILCQDGGFQKWVSKDAGWECDAADARSWLCIKVGIQSRSELASNADAGQRFREIEDRFMRESGRAVEVR